MLCQFAPHYQKVRDGFRLNSSALTMDCTHQSELILEWKPYVNWHRVCMHGPAACSSENSSPVLRSDANTNMGAVVLGRPASGLTMASTFSKATTEARVMHKAVKKMRKNRPKKVCRHGQMCQSRRYCLQNSYCLVDASRQSCLTGCLTVAVCSTCSTVPLTESTSQQYILHLPHHRQSIQ